MDKEESVEFYLKNAADLARSSFDGNVLTLDMLASYYVQYGKQKEMIFMFKSGYK